MGQTIEITDQRRLGDSLLVAFDRSLSGQDGETFFEAPSDGETFPAQLASRLFEAELAIDHVYVMSNTVSLRRPGGWDDEAAAEAAEVISGFFRFYPDGPGAPSEAATEQPSSEEAAGESSP